MKAYKLAVLAGSVLLNISATSIAQTGKTLISIDGSSTVFNI